MEHAPCRQGGEFHVAVSGGRDSMLLLYMMAMLNSDRVCSPGCNLRALHIDHGIRSVEESEKELNAVFSAAIRLRVPLTLYREPRGRIEAFASAAGGLESAARTLRYRVFNGLLNLPGESPDTASRPILLTAHHGDDSRETILQSLLEGNLGSRLLGIPPESPGIIRPFLLMSPPPGRDEITALCEDLNIAFVDDSSNRESFQRRNFLRNRIIPALNEHMGNVDGRMDSLRDSWREIHEYMQTQIPRTLWKPCSIPGREHLQASTEQFCELEPIIRRRSVQQALVNLSPPPREERIPEEFFRELERLACSSNGSTALRRHEGYGLTFHLEYGRIYLYSSLAPGRKKRYFVPLNTGRESRIQPAGGLTLIFTPVRRVAEDSEHGGELRNSVQSDAPFLRNLEDSESLKKYLKLPEKNEYLTLTELIRRRRIPEWMRRDIFLVEDGLRWYGIIFPDDLLQQWSFQPFYGGGNSRRELERELRSNPEMVRKYDITIEMEQCW